MNRLVILIGLVSFSIQLKSQIFQIDSIGLEYYNKGSELIRTGDYKLADSILSLALGNFKHRNVYYNRAIARLLLLDTVGYCQDMDIVAHHYFNGQSWFKAFIYSMEAAEKAQSQFSNQEALKYYDQSLNILDKFSDEDFNQVLDIIKKQLTKFEKAQKKAGKTK